jgi:LacI family transcriptional regulator
MKGSSEVTIYDVAKALNLSPSTVSRGLKSHPLLRKETVERIKAAANEMGYRHNKFASNLRQKHTNTIGVVVPRLDSYFMATVIAGIEKITNLHGYGLIISQSQESGKKEISCVSTLYNSRVDGLLISLAFDTKNTDYLKMLLNKNIPVVFFDRVLDHSGCMGVIIDNYKAGYEAVSHLIEEGCRKIVHITGNLSRNVYAERFRGYKEALADNNIDFEQDLVFVSDLSENSGVELASKIAVMDNPPDGIFAANDTTAVSVIIELQKSGLNIPEDIAVVGFNNEPACRIVKPNLTSVEYPAMNIGEIAATALIDLLKKPHSDALSTIVLKHNLRIRESSSRKKAKKS